MSVVPKDRISNLPLDVTHRILQFLPLKDAARMSVLSTYWRHKWRSLPDLIFDEHFITAIQTFAKKCTAPSIIVGRIQVLEYSNAVNSILLNHVGPIRKFVFQNPGWFPINLGIGQWLQFVSHKSVKEFTLNQEGNQRRKVPHAFWSMHLKDLTRLELVNCSLVFLQPTFPGFPNLTSLHLDMSERSHASEVEKMEILISSCTQLEKLYVSLRDKESSLTVKAPKLQHLGLEGCLDNIYLEGTMNIKTVTLDIDWYDLDNGATGFFSCLSCVEKINLNDKFWRGFRKSEGTVTLSNMQHLTALTIIGADLCDHASMSFILHLLQNSPLLQNLVIDAYCFGSREYPVIKGFCRLDHLKNVRVAWYFRSIVASDVALELVRLILLNSPILESMTIEARRNKGADSDDDVDDEHEEEDSYDYDDIYGDDDDEVQEQKQEQVEDVKELDIAKKLLEYHRASSAKIILKT